jgi:hypothetical protein
MLKKFIVLGKPPKINKINKVTPNSLKLLNNKKQARGTEEKQ